MYSTHGAPLHLGCISSAQEPHTAHVCTNSWPPLYWTDRCGVSLLKLGLAPLCTRVFSSQERSSLGTSLVFQWLRLHGLSGGGPGPIPGQGTRLHRPQLNIMHAAAKTWHSQISKYLSREDCSSLKARWTSNNLVTSTAPCLKGLFIKHWWAKLNWIKTLMNRLSNLASWIFTQNVTIL